MQLAYYTHPDCALHTMGPGHPEQPDRVRCIDNALNSDPCWQAIEAIAAPLATQAQLQLAHDAGYIDHLFQSSPQIGQVQLDADTAMNPHSLTAALRAAGAAVAAVDRLFTGDSRRAFCNIRPPGHHAERDKAMGFCLFNNVAVAARYAMAEYGVNKVAIIDFDVHHGNGTEDIFRDDQRVLLCSSFQHPFYPFSGGDTRSHHIVNLPLPAFVSPREYRQRVAECWFDALDQFAPELVIISAGFDAHRDDPLGQFNLLEEDYTWLTEQIVAVADRHGDGRVISCLEGGYDLSALARSALAHVRALTSR